MAIQISGVQLGNIGGGPSSLNLSDLHDVLIVTPLTGQYLRYNGTISEWQNQFLNTDVYNYLNTNLTGSNGVSLTKLSGPQTIDIALSLSATGDATGTVASGSLPLTLATVNSTVGSYGSASAVPVVTVDAKGRITNITTVAIGGTSTNLAGGTVGAIPYQSAASVTSFVSAGTSSQVFISGTTPSWTNTPTLTGTNFTGIPNSALTNGSLILGSTSLALGSTTTTVAGLTSVTSTTFVGALTGTSTNSTNSNITNDVASGTANYITMVTSTTGNLPIKTSSTGLYFVPSTGLLSATGFAGSGASLTNIPNSALTNSSLTLGSTSLALGSTTTTVAGLASVTSTTFVGALTGNATTATSATSATNATTATNLASGAANSVPYQSSAGATVFLAQGTGVLQETAGAPSWTTVPTLTGTNFTGVPNSALTGSGALTLGSTSLALGSTTTTVAGLTSVTSTTFVGALTGNASTATSANTSTSATTATNVSGGAAGSILYQTGASTTSSLTAGTSSQILISGTTPSWTNTPTLTGTNFTGVPNAALTNSSLTLGSTSLALGSTTTTVAGLTSVTSTTFAGALTGAASSNILKAGDTMTGYLILNADPVSNLGAVTKQYVDTVAAGIHVHQACETSTTAPLAACTYNNGAAGVGATLTANSNGILGTVGGYTNLVVGTRVLVKDQVSTLQNGIYKVSSLGVNDPSGSPWILTRTTDFDGSPTSELAAGELTYVQEGTLQGTQWVETAIGTGVPNDYIIVGTNPIVFGQFSGAGTYSAGVGISINSNVIANTGVLSTIAGSNISVSGATGNVTIALTGTVPSATTSTNVSGGAANSIPYQSGAGATVFLAQGTGVLQETAGAPSWTTSPSLTGTNFTGVPNAALTNSSLTLGSTSLALGSTTTTIAGLASVTSTTFIGALTGNATTATSASTATSATTATNVTGGAANSIPYQSGAGATTFLAQGTGVLQETAGAPSWTTAPTLTGTNFTSVPNAALTNSSLTIGSTSLALGSTTTTVAGLTSVTSTTFIGALTGNATTATSATTSTNSTNATNATNATNVAITDDTTTNATKYILWVDAISGNNPNKVSSTKLTFNPLSGVLTATQFAGSGAGLTSIPNAALTNSSLTLGSTSLALGSTTTTIAGLASVTSTTFVGALTGNATTATTATNVTGGAAGSILYQTGAATTSSLTAGTSSQVLISGTTPSWTNAPTLTGTNFTGIPNVALTNSSLTLGSTSMALGSTTTTVAGLTSVTSTTFVGALNGNASTATSATSATTATNIGGGVAGGIPYQTGVGATALLAPGTAGQVLSSNGAAAPTWVATTSFNGGTVSNVTTFTFAGNAVVFNPASGTTTGIAVTTGAAAGNNFSITGSNATNGIGGAVNLIAGNGTGTFTGGAINLTAGNGVTTGIGGAVVISGGTAVNAAAGAVSLTGGNSSNGNAGQATIQGGTANNGAAVNVIGGTALTNIGGQVNITGGATQPSLNGLTSGAVVISTLGGADIQTGAISITTAAAQSAGNGRAAGAITITSGAGAGAGANGGTAGDITVNAGASGAGTGATAGNIKLTAGLPAASASATSGYISFTTGPVAGALTERFRILNNGAWSIGTAGTATGTSGQVLISAGSAAVPAWGAVVAPAGTLTGTTLAAGVTASSLTSVGTLILNADPVNVLGAATKQYVDAQVVTASAGLVIVIVSSTTQAATTGNQYVLTNTGASTTVTLPASPTNGGQIWITNITNRTDCVIANNGQLLMGLSQNMTINTLNVNIQLRYINSTYGWRIM